MTAFSLVITSYNHAGYIREAVESAFAQIYPPKEVIVVEDASADNSAELLRGYGERICLIEHSVNQGISRTRNDGAARATGEYIAYLDGDDILKPWALATYEQIVRTFHARMILGCLTWFGQSPPQVSAQDFPTHITVVNYETLAQKDRTFRSSASALVMERTAFERVHGWTEGIAMMQDHDLLAKFAGVGPVIQILTPATVFYRSHQSNTYKNTERLIADSYNLLAAYKSGRENGARKLVGGPLMFVLKRAYAAGLYLQGLRLLAHTWHLVIAAAVARARVKLFGRLPSETLAVEFDRMSSAKTAGR
jgi:glycosyltransferase involved in cell wall biosynthesis